MLHLVDASYFVFRAYYSVTPEMTDADGQPVNALYGFARFMGDLLERAGPEQVGVAFDQSLATSFRNDIYPAYKANREPAPEELKRQFAWCREFCRLMGVAEYADGYYEADDIIGAIATRMRAAGHCSVLVTRDKDLAQLVRHGDEFWDFAGDRRYGYADIAGQFGVLPERMPDYLALTGDSVDNIPGVPGIGPKTASALLDAYESLDHLYDNLHALSALPIRGAARLPERLVEHREAAYLARRLTQIACDMPLDFRESDLQRRRPDVEGLAALYERSRFGPMLARQAERLAQRFGE